MRLRVETASAATSCCRLHSHDGGRLLLNAADSPLLEALRAVDRHMGIRSDLRLARPTQTSPWRKASRRSPWEPAATAAARTRAREWYSDKNRETGLKRVLLLTLAMAEWAADCSPRSATLPHARSLPLACGRPCCGFVSLHWSCANTHQQTPASANSQARAWRRSTRADSLQRRHLHRHGLQESKPETVQAIAIGGGKVIAIGSTKKCSVSRAADKAA